MHPTGDDRDVVLRSRGEGGIARALDNRLQRLRGRKNAVQFPHPQRAPQPVTAQNEDLAGDEAALKEVCQGAVTRHRAREEVAPGKHHHLGRPDARRAYVLLEN
jgi:hypothetical protein